MTLSLSVLKADNSRRLVDVGGSYFQSFANMVLSQSVEMLHVLEHILKEFATYKKKMLYLTC